MSGCKCSFHNYLHLAFMLLSRWWLHMFRTRMRLLVNSLKMIYTRMSVYLCRCQRWMTQKLFDHSYISTCIKHMRGKTMSKYMWTLFIDFWYFFNAILDNLLHQSGIYTLPFFGQENGLTVWMMSCCFILQSFMTRRKMLLKGVWSFFPEWNNSLFLTFTHYNNLFLDQVQ